MNKLTQETEKELFKVFELALIIQKEKIGTTFFEISGHVKWLSIRIYKDEWIPNASIDGINNISASVNTESLIELIKLKSWLQEILLFKSVVPYNYSNI